MKGIRIFLLRHGNTFEKGQQAVQIGLQTDLPLTEKGRKQAEDFASLLIAKDIRPTAVYSGDLLRQKGTAQIIVDRLQLQNSFVNVNKHLNEIDYGRWEGKTTEELTAEYPEEYRKWTTQAAWPANCFVGSPTERLNDIKCFIDDVKDKHQDGEEIVAVSSNGFIRYFYSLLTDEWRKLLRDEVMDSLKVKTGHFCILRIFPGQLRIEAWNSSPQIALF